MKLRQKLAVVLASAMVVTAVPVVTMAASTIGLKYTSMAIAKDEEWTFTEDSITTAQALQVIFTGHVSGNEVFYVTVEEAEFKEDTYDNNFTDQEIDEAVFAVNVDLYEEAGVNISTSGSKTINGVTYTSVAGQENVKFQRQGKKEIKVIVSDALAQASKVKNRPVTIPLAIKAGDGELKVAVDPANSSIDKTSLVAANTSSKAMEYSVGEKTTFYTDPGSKLAELTIKETYKGAMNKLKNSDADEQKKRIITIELEDSDFNFYDYPAVSEKTVADIIADGKKLVKGTDYDLKRGFYGQNFSIYAAVDKKDEGKLYIYIDQPSVGDSQGEIVFKNLLVDSIVKDPDEGDFLVDIKSDALKSEGENVVMGEVTAFKNYIKMKDEKVVDVVGGRIKEIEFEVGEAVENTMISNRTFELKLQDNAHFDYKGLVKDINLDQDGNAILDANGEVADLDDNGKADEEKDWKIAAAKLNRAELADKIIENFSTTENKDWKGMEVEFDTDEDGVAIVDTLIVKVGMPKEHRSITPNNYDDPAQNNDHKDAIKFKVKVCVPIDKKNEEKVVLSASGRALENEVYETTAINIKNPINIEYTETTLKVGLKDQESTASYTITETDKAMFMEDGELYIGIKGLDKDASDGLRIASADFEINGEIKRVKTKENDENVKFTFKRDSNAAATIKVTNVTFDVDRTVPEGNYDIEIWGSAICQESKDYSTVTGKAHKIVIEDAIKIGTPNTEDITAGGLVKGTTTFVIGESKYISNGVEVTMDAPSYIQDPGYTMVPVRYVAQAFGVDSKNILFGNGTVTIFAGERTLSLTNGSNMAVVNGNTVAMGTAVVIKDGRTYAPAGEIARLLGISTSWDSATKTATFTN